MADTDFLTTCLARAVAPRFAMPRVDLLCLMRLAGVEDTAAYRWAVLDEQEMIEVEAAGVRELVELARAGG